MVWGGFNLDLEIQSMPIDWFLRCFMDHGLTVVLERYTFGADRIKKVGLRMVLNLQSPPKSLPSAQRLK